MHLWESCVFQTRTPHSPSRNVSRAGAGKHSPAPGSQPRRQAGLQICVPNCPPSPPRFPRRLQVLGRPLPTSLPPRFCSKFSSGICRRKGAQPLRSWGRSSGLVGQFGQDLGALRRDDHCVLELGGPGTHGAGRRRSGLARAAVSPAPRDEPSLSKPLRSHHL